MWLFVVPRYIHLIARSIDRRESAHETIASLGLPLVIITRFD